MTPDHLPPFLVALLARLEAKADAVLAHNARTALR